MAEKDADVQKIKELIQLMQENDLEKIDIRHGEDRIALRRAQPQPPAPAFGPIVTSMPGAVGPVTSPPGPTAQPAPNEEGQLLEVKAPIVGTVYEASSPDSDAFVEPGTHVDPQTVVCIIEAMKVMNEIKAEVSGTVVEKVAKNGQAVEYGQVLLRVRPD
jgi:acetyl-CoA carboxylase biotin carboxyl carrier protein